jgi:hypothetical protein
MPQWLALLEVAVQKHLQAVVAVAAVQQLPKNPRPPFQMFLGPNPLRPWHQLAVCLPLNYWQDWEALVLP